MPITEAQVYFALNFLKPITAKRLVRQLGAGNNYLEEGAVHEYLFKLRSDRIAETRRRLYGLGQPGFILTPYGAGLMEKYKKALEPTRTAASQAPPPAARRGFSRQFGSR